MLQVYDYHTNFYSCSAGIDFRRQILTSKVDPHCQGYICKIDIYSHSNLHTYVTRSHKISRKSHFEVLELLSDPESPQNYL